MGNAILKDDVNDDQIFADELAPGAELMHGQYKIESFLNAGGFGITYSARDSLDRRVVIKECFPGAFCRRSRALVQARSRAHQNELASIVRLFVQEARSLAKLNHPNIVGVHQVFEENNTAYMALDYIDGRDLLDIIEDDETDLAPADIEDILHKVLDAVGFIHDQGILHRDISPDNILLDSHGEPVLIDFGAAREQATKQSRVLSALRVVKDGYSPQEFYITGSEQGPYSDLYALGASFYHLVAGDVPPNSQARLSAVATGEGDIYRPLSGKFPDYKPAFLESIDKALEILPKDRIASAATWQAMIEGKVVTSAPEVVPAPSTGSVSKSTAGAAAPASEPKSKKGLLLATVALVIVAGAGFVATQTDLLSGFGIEAPVAQSAGEGTSAAAAPDAVASEATAVRPVEPAGAVEDAPAATGPVEAGAAQDAPEAVAPVETDAAQDAAEDVVPAEADAAQDEAGAAIETPLADVAGTASAVADAALADAPDVASEAQDVSAILPFPLTEQGAEALAIGATDAPVSVPALWTRSIPNVAPSAPLAMPVAAGLIEATDRVERRAVLDNLPTPTLDPAGPVRTVAAEAGDTAAIRIVADTPFVFTRAVATQPDAPAVEILASFDSSVPPAPVRAPVQAEAAQVTIPGVTHEAIVLLPLRGLFDLGEGSTRIFAVNGVDVDSLAAFNAVVRETANLQNASTVDLTVKMGTQASTAEQQNWTLPVAQSTSLANGWLFETTVEDEGWVTRVIDVPVGASGDIRPGDIVYGYIPNAQRLDQRTSFLEILAQEAEAGTATFNFAMKRGDLAWAETIQFDAKRFAN